MPTIFGILSWNGATNLKKSPDTDNSPRSPVITAFVEESNIQKHLIFNDDYVVFKVITTCMPTGF
jgi:hypothetical protein